MGITLFTNDSFWTLKEGPNLYTYDIAKKMYLKELGDNNTSVYMVSL